MPEGEQMVRRRQDGGVAGGAVASRLVETSSIAGWTTAGTRTITAASVATSGPDPHRAAGMTWTCAGSTVSRTRSPGFVAAPGPGSRPATTSVSPPAVQRSSTVGPRNTRSRHRRVEGRVCPAPSARPPALGPEREIDLVTWCEGRRRRSPRASRPRAPRPGRRSPDARTTWPRTTLAAPMNRATKADFEPPVYLLRGPDLREAAGVEHRDLVRDRERLFLVVRDVNRGNRQPLEDARGGRAACAGGDSGRGSRAARREGGRRARSRRPGHGTRCCSPPES